MTNDTNINITPPAKQTVLVHKKGAEGAMSILLFEGTIVTPADQRPEWAEGLVQALTGERLQFYGQRLGKDYLKDLTKAEAVAFEDLAWLVMTEGVDANDEPIFTELSADVEFRMNALAEYAGMTRPADLSEAVVHSGKWNVVAEASLAFDADRSDEEARALETAQKQEFGQKAAEG